MKRVSNNGVKGWGDLNVALNGLVRAGVIISYKTARPEKNGGAASVEVVTASGADQAEVVKQVRAALPEAFAAAAVRTTAA